MDLDQIFANLWREYRAITPLAGQVHRLLNERGDEVKNDHIALRTFDTAGLGTEPLARVFVERGYIQTGEYVFPNKKLRAASYSHPGGEYPRAFISEFQVDNLSSRLKGRLLDVLGDLRGDPLAWFDGQAPWPPVSFALYQGLREESEYAAWVAAHGIRANHFTVSFDALASFSDLEDLNTFLVNRGFALNESGGVIKGSVDELLEQSSTLADRATFTFGCGRECAIPSCYYEFARRYRDPATGAPFDGFIAESAGRIFESTDEVR